MINAALDEDRVRELEEIGIADVKEELKNDCLPEHLIESARIWLKIESTLRQDHRVTPPL